MSEKCVHLRSISGNALREATEEAMGKWVLWFLMRNRLGTATVSIMRNVHDEAWNLGSPTVVVGLFQGVYFRITALGKPLRSETSCGVQGHSEMSYPQKKLINWLASSW